MSGRIDPETESDFNQMLHELRGRELERVPADARIILSGGSAGDWYFPWFEERYSGAIARHIGVEAYAPRPARLPAGVEWIESTLGSIQPVSSSSVELVFAGQVIEHLWPEEVAGFLTEARRVLKGDGLLVLDSPNRVVTEAQGIVQPEHTTEFAVDEVVELVELAGFDVADVRGIWHCFDAAGRRQVPANDLNMTTAERRRRIEAARGAPEQSFVWWLEARRADRPPDTDRLLERSYEICERFRRVACRRIMAAIGTRAWSPQGDPVATTRAEESGAALYGPYVPMRPGAYRVTFALGRTDEAPADGGPVVAIEVAAGDPMTPLVQRWIEADELPRGADLAEFTLEFDLSASTTMGLQTRVIDLGRIGLVTRLRAPVAPRPIP